ncbi:potassium-transporting ATPase subunit KdpA [Klebsiella pneumoniae]|nr:potassium-transporting ATPase subunit KdpA [Klebsiella pneumoniae]
MAKKIQPASPGTAATHDALFIGLLIGTVLLVAPAFIPALALGPLAEHFSLL